MSSSSKNQSKEQLTKLALGAIGVVFGDIGTSPLYALKEVFLDILSEDQFMEFMTQKGKMGGQHKFPRVLKGNMLKDWQKFIQEKHNAV